MPTKRRRRELPPADACADVEREGHELPQSGSNVGEGSVPGELHFFDYLDSLTAEQWGDRIIYIYRQDPRATIPATAITSKRSRTRSMKSTLKLVTAGGGTWCS